MTIRTLDPPLHEFLPNDEATIRKLAPSEPLQLVSFTAPVGRTTGALHRVALPVEQWGWAISGLSLAVILGIAAVSARNTHR